MFDGSMSMSFHTLNYPTHVLRKTHIYRHVTVKSTRVTPSVSTSSPYSILLHIGEKEKCVRNSVQNKPTSSMINRCNNRIGIIGGVSVDSTLYFLQKLVEWSSKDGKDCPPFILTSDTPLRDELLIYERRSFPTHYTRARPSDIDHTPIVENLRSKRAFLEQGGARCMVMPCHLLHSWYDDVSEECNVPVIHMAECVARELKEAKLRPLEAGCRLRIGLVATDAILKSGFYQDKLQNEGFEVVLPDKAAMEHTLIPAIEALDRKDIEGARNLLRVTLQVLLVRAVNMVIIASHDMRELLPQDDPLRKKCVDPIDALVRSTIRWSQSVEGGS